MHDSCSVHINCSAERLDEAADRLRHFNFLCATSMDIGRVALLLEVLNATTITSEKFLKNVIGFLLAISATVDP